MTAGRTGPNGGGAPPVSGFINLYKPVGITSMDALRQVKKVTGQKKKVGHAGTMDPLARGVLPICFGQATRLMEYVVDGHKRYCMDIRLGATTQTYDSEGEVTPVRKPDYVTPEMIGEAFSPFLGTIEQKPPMYSAVKVDGQRLYKLARAGVEIDRAPRTVEVFDIRLTGFNLPTITLEVECGRGVYMRSLAHDLGAALGCGGFVTDLERQYCAGFESSDGVTPQDLAAEVDLCPDSEAWKSHLFPIDYVLQKFRAVTLGEAAEKALKNGQAVSAGRSDPDAGYLEQFRAYSQDGRFLALVRYERAGNLWQPVKVFHSAGSSPYTAP